MSPSTTTITVSLPADKQGVASALNDTVRELGGAVGVALAGVALLFLVVHGPRPNDVVSEDALDSVGDLGTLPALEPVAGN